MTKPRTNGFTLIEMLTVIVIIGIMLVLTIPAVTTLMKSSGLSVAERHVSSTLSLARQLAITQRVYARVVFPYSATISDPEKWYRTYAVMTNRNNTVAASWRYASKWEYLPLGVVFLNMNPSGGASPLPLGAGALNDPNSLNSESVPFPDATAGAANLAYIEFSPIGTAKPLTVPGPNVLVITEGFVDSGISPTPTPTSKTSGGALVNVVTLSVDSLVGRIKVMRP